MLEAAQHFKPLKQFFSESKRILKNDGLLVLAIPVMTEKSLIPISKMGLLSMTWSSEHYSTNFVLSLLEQEGFTIINQESIGSMVYEPLADYYVENRNVLKKKILKSYPSYVEKILYRSLIKMKKVSKNKIIDYLLIVCEPKNE